LLLLVEETAEPDAEKGWFAYEEAVDAFEPVAMDDTMLSALEGRAKGFGERRPLMMPPSLGLGDVEGRDDGCWRTAKTKVLLIASLEHCGCIT
jgi:hypothetical protein